MFVTFEGIEGSGKSTALKALAEALRAGGERVFVTREPGGCDLGLALRALLLDARKGPLSPRAELFLFLADRAQHVAHAIRPALEAGEIVLCDRFTDSTLAYQGDARGIDMAELRRLNAMATEGLAPDLTLLFDLPVETGLARAARRNRAEGTIESEGRFDAEKTAFHQKVRDGYLRLAAGEPARFVIIDASAPADAVARQCRKALAERAGRRA